MKRLKQISFISTIILAFAHPGSAQAIIDGGISGSGGGNTVNHKMVEDLVIDPHDLNGSELFEQQLRRIEKDLPVFGQELRNSYEDLTFYSIPSKLKLLPKSKTGLDFKNEQLAEHQDGEIFINEEGFKKLDAKGTAEFLMHEALMSLTKTKQSAPVRKVVTKIFDAEATPESIQKALAENGFGPNFTAGQLQSLKAFYRTYYLRRIGGSLDEAEADCGKSPDRANRLYYTTKALFGRMMEQEKNNGHGGWYYGPFTGGDDAQSNVRYGWRNAQGNGGTCMNDLEYQAKNFARLNPKVIGPVMAQELQLMPNCSARPDSDLQDMIKDAGLTNAPEIDLRVKMYSANMTAVNDLAADDRLAITRQLSQLPAFLNLSAVPQMAFFTEDHPRNLETKNFDVTWPSDNVTKDLEKISKSIAERYSAIKDYSEDDKAKLFCTSVAPVRSQVDRMIDPSADTSSAVTGEQPPIAPHSPATAQ